ncbi:MAG: nucleotidyl transferase AbiEii/AbiGii toxin family protein [Candidatus Amesbacteria bacterium]|nr:nucleotidyl transferase AbiEii/AbiGii toxin family protein [Candidatus Amesbacteria bacterium]
MLNPILHRNILIQILKSVYSNSTLGPILGFKGGTAAMMFYELPRFSVDLDFDLLNSKLEDKIMAEMPKLLQKFGDVQVALKKKYTLLFVLSHQKGQRLVKIEVSRRTSHNHSYEVKNFLGLAMLVVKQSDMVASKLSALLTRKKFASRDVFDVWYFLNKNWEINKDILLAETGFSKKIALSKALKMIEKIDPDTFMPGLGELVDNKTKFWIKNHLKEEVLFLLKTNLL